MFDRQEHDRACYDDAPMRFACTAGSVEELAEWQRAFRPELERALGLPAIAAHCATHEPRAERLSTEACDGFTRERWSLWTEPTVPLPVWVLRPADASGELPLVLCPHGHNQPDVYAGLARDDAEHAKMVEGERDIAVQAAREGYLALAPTTRGFGDTRSAADREADKLSSCRVQLLHGLLVGRTAVGERVWDMQRCLDWALRDLGADADRVAITGNSGGGTVSLFAAACEERIRVAMPSCYFCTFRASIGSIHHCDCNYVPGMLQLGEMSDVAALIAPRPISVIAGELDEIFPIAAVREAYAALQRSYAAAGAADRCQLHVGDGGHRYYSAGAWPFLRRAFAEQNA